MARRTNLKYTDEMRSYIWDRYQQGDSVWSIARSMEGAGVIEPHRQMRMHGIGASDRNAVNWLETARLANSSS